MLDKLKENKEAKRIGGNIISLALVNGVGLLSPLVLIPYLLRVIGSEEYGIYIFSWTFISYFVILVNYGYDFYATKEIAVNRNSQDFVSKIFNEVSVSRLILALISVLIVLICVYTVPELQLHKNFILLGMGVFIGQSIHPTWIFQGMEEMGFITLITLITRIVPIILVFFFVFQPSDAYKVMLFQSIGYIVGGVTSNWLAIKKYKLKITIPSLNSVWSHIKGAWYLFVTTVGITMYRETNVVILGFMTGNYVLVGFYSIADKFIRLFQMCITPIVQALYPYFGNKFGNQASATKTIMTVGKYITLFLLVLCVFIWIFANHMVDIYVGKPSPEIAFDLRIMTPILVVSGLSYLFGIDGLVNIGKEKVMTLFVLIVGCINIIMCFYLSKPLEDIGAAISITTAEILLSILILSYFIKQINRNEQRNTI